MRSDLPSSPPSMADPTTARKETAAPQQQIVPPPINSHRQARARGIQRCTHTLFLHYSCHYLSAASAQSRDKPPPWSSRLPPSRSRTGPGWGSDLITSGCILKCIRWCWHSNNSFHMKNNLTGHVVLRLKGKQGRNIAANFRYCHLDPCNK